MYPQFAAPVLPSVRRSNPAEEIRTCKPGRQDNFFWESDKVLGDNQGASDFARRSAASDKSGHSETYHFEVGSAKCEYGGHQAI